MNYDSRIETQADGEPADLAAINPLLEPDEEDRASRKRLWIIAAVVLVVMIAIYWMSHRGAADTDAAKKNQVPLVSVISPGSATIEGQINASGSLAARRELPVGVPGEGGQVVSVLVEPGQWVGAGQVLAVIDRSVQVQQQASQAAQIQVTRANADLAQANLDRALRLVEKGFVSKADIDRLRATRDAAAAQVRVAGAQLGVLQAQTRRLSVVAPSAGLVLERRIEPGQVVSAGSGVLFRLAKGGEMEMKALLGEVDLAKVSQGVSASVTPVGGTTSHAGQVWQVSPVVDPATRQGTARIALPYAADLRPGGFANAVIKAGTVVAPMLPDSAVLSDAKGSYVYVIGADNKVQRRDIVTGMITDKGTAIVGGLNGNEKIVARSGAFLAPGQEVKTQAVAK
ncbi:efflux RND transporter periplasmic adaptor subunit [Novosphingobium sp. B 225]|uniref:efflux RND transporter periplasmic adaptor subunit n=1 Tax=Novosphingobium sp. B 225 TaxID=1961849 RepID=UPI000B4B006E|nr:efflux RND transporter periplasmic adaptor subunit [Novosphingobium sp. B 225]